ncbi:MAG: hypothetical protein LBC97_11195 [Bifidobacteriaceae bacterium]|jgi:hypothetical protein|nr:hypothetical protein [Bifidobacteriaceae bacterium]
MRTRLAASLALGALGAGLLTGVGSLAFADDLVEHDTVDVWFEVPDEKALTMTVAANEAELTEGASADPTQRVFTGTLPTVTVTDTRDAEDIPAGVGWAVLAGATDFQGDAGQADIPANQLGWTPSLIAGEDLGLVSAGGVVASRLDDTGSDGIAADASPELLAMALDSGAAAEEQNGVWQATAALVLKTDAIVEPGKYTSELTLSLFE